MLMRTAIAALTFTVIGAIGGCGEAASGDGDQLRNEALVRRWLDDGFNERKVTVVDELFAEQFAVNGTVIGRAGLKRSMQRHIDAFPDLHVTVDDLLADDNKVVVWYTVQGTHSGEFEGISPTSRRVKWSGADLLYFEGGEIARAFFLSDLNGLLAQLGATVSVPQPSN